MFVLLGMMSLITFHAHTFVRRITLAYHKIFQRREAFLGSDWESSFELRSSIAKWYALLTVNIPFLLGCHTLRGEVLGLLDLPSKHCFHPEGIWLFSLLNAKEVIIKWLKKKKVKRMYSSFFLFFFFENKKECILTFNEFKKNISMQEPCKTRTLMWLDNISFSCLLFSLLFLNQEKLNCIW